MRRIVRLLCPDCRWFVGFVMAWVLGAVGRAASSDEPRGGDVVVMSPFEVSANSFEFIGWQVFRSPHFVVYSDGGEKTVRPILRQMEMLHFAAQALLERPAPAHAPVLVVLPTSGSDWRKLRSRGNVRWKVSVSSFSRFGYCIVAEYDWEREGPKTLWAALGGLEASWIGPEPSFAVAKGICSFFETASFQDNTVTLGEFNDRLRNLNNQGWIPWEHFFSLTSQSPEYVRDGPDLHRFMAQSALLGQFIFDESAPERRGKMRQWNSVFEAGWRPTEKLFQALFDSDYAALQKELWSMVLNERSKPRSFTVPADDLDFEVTVETAKTKAMRELFVLTQILNQRVNASEVALDSLLGKGLETVELRPLLIEACLNWKRSRAAEALLDELIVEDASTPEVYAMAAALRIERAVGVAMEVTARLSAEDTAQINAWCERALALEPRLAQANEVSALAAGWGAAEGTAQVEHVVQRYEVLQREGRMDWCLAALGMAEARAGNEHEARRVCEYLLRSIATRPRVQQIARDILATFETEPAN